MSDLPTMNERPPSPTLRDDEPVLTLTAIWHQVRGIVSRYAFPFFTPYILHVLCKGDGVLIGLSIAVCPFLFLFVGMYIATGRGPKIARGTNREVARRIAELSFSYKNWHDIATVLLAVFELAAGVATTLVLPWSIVAYLGATVVLFLPYVLLLWHAEERLSQAYALAIASGAGG